MSSYVCPICGFPELPEPPRGPNGGASFDNCPVCAFEFGYHDDDQGHTYESWRAGWVADGMPWRIPEWPQPPNWDPRAQLARLMAGGEGERGTP